MHGKLPIDIMRFLTFSISLLLAAPFQNTYSVLGFFFLLEKLAWNVDMHINIHGSPVSMHISNNYCESLYVPQGFINFHIYLFKNYGSVVG